MPLIPNNIQIILAQSILGLKPSGVEKLGESLLNVGLAAYLNTHLPAIQVPTLNNLYSNKREPDTNCLNTKPLRSFCKTLAQTTTASINNGHFPFVLGGDCSILIGPMLALKARGDYGLIFLDAHADFYSPDKSITGEVADMDLAIVTGRGPELLTNIDGLKPYIKDDYVVHVGQRDWEETQQYGSEDICKTGISCFGLAAIEAGGADTILKKVLAHIEQLDAAGFWIHFDTDVLSDEINPAVDYRIPRGLTYNQVEILIKNILLTKRICGISVTIFNPALDTSGQIAKNIANCLANAFNISG